MIIFKLILYIYCDESLCGFNTKNFCYEHPFTFKIISNKGFIKKKNKHRYQIIHCSLLLNSCFSTIAALHSLHSLHSVPCPDPLHTSF